jgi:hypothetical protein
MFPAANTIINGFVFWDLSIALCTLVWLFLSYPERQKS